MFELELVKSVSVVDYDLTNFDEICRFFEDHNKGTESPWSWEEAFQLKGKAFDLLWEGKITHPQHSRFWDAVSVPLF